MVVAFPLEPDVRFNLFAHDTSRNIFGYIPLNALPPEVPFQILVHLGVTRVHGVP